MTDKPAIPRAFPPHAKKVTAMEEAFRRDYEAHNVAPMKWRKPSPTAKVAFNRGIFVGLLIALVLSIADHMVFG